MAHFAHVAHHALRSNFALGAGWIAFILICCGSSGCSSTDWEASAKRRVIQAQLEAIGREPIDADAVLAEIEPTLASAELDWNAIRLALEAALSPRPSFHFDSFWAAIESTVLKPKGLTPDERKNRLRAQLTSLLKSANEDNRLYWSAKGRPQTASSQPVAAATQPASAATQPASAATQPTGTATPPTALASRPAEAALDPQSARDALMSKYILRIQDYHEANYGDLFRTSAYAGLWLDSGVVIASALATAFTPASTKTALAAAATIFGGVRLSASRNVLNEKAFSTVMNAMLTQRTLALATLTAGLKQPVSAYGVDQALIDLASYFNVGSIDKALAQIERNTSEAQGKADGKLSEARREVSGTFQATGLGTADKWVANLRFARNAEPGALGIQEIIVGGRVLDASAYDASKVAEAGHPIEFDANKAVLDGELVQIRGTASKQGLFVGTIEWR